MHPMITVFATILHERQTLVAMQYIRIEKSTAEITEILLVKNKFNKP